MTRMATGELATRVGGLMDRTHDDLAELVSFRSVADRAQYPAAESAAAARWVMNAFAEAGLRDVTASPRL